MKRFQKWCALLLALCLCAAPGYAAEDADTNAEMRVLLRSLGAPASLDITLAGSYGAGENAFYRFARGSAITVTAYDGALYVSCGGMTVSMGAAFTLTRYACEGENGLYIEGSQRGLLYEGDLHMRCLDGAVQAILTIDLERYLYGVVPYEMSDSFPLDALKAQAVAARTFALDRRAKNAARDYDLTDTTADQVFMGYDADNANAIMAVDETRGMVGMWNGTYATCFYTASNGGQTALPADIWSGEGDYGYLSRREDPYDLSNARSVSRSATLSAAGGDWPDALLDVLLSNATESLAALGYSDERSDIRVTRVSSVEAVGAAEEGSRLYTALRVAYEVEGRKLIPQATPAPTRVRVVRAPGLSPLPTATPEPSPAFALSGFEDIGTELTVEIPIFDTVKDALELGINGGDYELFTVTTQTDGDEVSGFTVTARRYGHGVGMSQRGAQEMAGVFGKTCEEILAFYYPGMTVETLTLAEKTLTPLPALFGATEELPLPALETGERYGVVTLSGDADALNVRATPTTESEIVARLAEGERVIVAGEAAEGWYRIRTATIEGCVSAAYIVIS